ncbi:uroporphyrinogen decarboxylase family protein, partial [Thermodesulfobacteriota bacterium]
SAFDAVDCKQIKLPGRDVPSNHSFQFVEGEYMKAEEYDAFLDDHTDFTIRTFLPRVYGTFKSFEAVPPIKALLFAYSGLSLSSVFANLGIVSAIESFWKAGLLAKKHNEKAREFNKEMEGLGLPLLISGVASAPFDLFSDQLRGMKGVMLDMYRQPDKLLAAIDKITPMLIELAVVGSKISGKPGVFIPLHRGADGFMSLEQFETFYWKSLKKLILALIDEDLIPCPFFEGNFTTRLEYLTELPKGKILGFFDNTDIYKAKEILSDTMCMSGLMPLSLLQTGTPETVKAYTKELIDVVGKDEGFIMGPKSAMDEAKPELVKVWFEFTKEYGVYG